MVGVPELLLILTHTHTHRERGRENTCIEAQRFHLPYERGTCKKNIRITSEKENKIRTKERQHIGKINIRTANYYCKPPPPACGELASKKRGAHVCGCAYDRINNPVLQITARKS